MLRENAAATAATSRLRVVVLLRLCSDSAGAVAVFTSITFAAFILFI